VKRAETMPRSLAGESRALLAVSTLAVSQSGLGAMTLLQQLQRQNCMA